MLKKKIFFSILVPTFNRIENLNNLLNSIKKNINNSFNLEVVIVNDGSQEKKKYKNLINKFKKFFLIKYIYSNKVGISLATKKGIKHCSGDYTILMDDDDIFLTNKILNIYELIKDKKFKLYFFNNFKKFKFKKPFFNYEIKKNRKTNYFKLLASNECKYDVKAVVNTELLKLYGNKQKIDIGERIPFGLYLAKISDKYDCYSYTEKVAVKNYLIQGMTNNKRYHVKKNPRGMFLFYQIAQSTKKYNNMLYRIKTKILYYRYAYHLKKNLKNNLFFSLIGFWLFKYDIFYLDKKANQNEEKKTIENFGDEWKKFDQSKLPHELKKIFQQYFEIAKINKNFKKFIVADFGCGSGRWSKILSPYVKKVYCIDASDSVFIAKKNLSKNSNISFVKANLNELPFKKNFFDFGFCLGVLHHIKDTKSALQQCIVSLKHGAKILMYFYYALDNKPFFYKFLWKLSNVARKIIVCLPRPIVKTITDLIAIIVYFPLSKICFALSLLKIDTKNFPLNFYKNSSFYTMRTDALDRFGTSIEKRYSKKEILKLLKECGLKNIIFSNKAPYWCVIATK